MLEGLEDFTRVFFFFLLKCEKTTGVKLRKCCGNGSLCAKWLGEVRMVYHSEANLLFGSPLNADVRDWDA